MRNQWKPKVRRMTEDMFCQQKWVMLVRDHEMDDWRPFGNKLSGKEYVYGDLDKAIYAQRNVQSGRYHKGNTKLVKVQDFEAFMLKQRGPSDGSVDLQD